MDVHEVVEVGSQRAPVLTRQFVRVLDGLGLPVGPVDLVHVERQSKRMRQVGRNQHL